MKKIVLAVIALTLSQVSFAEIRDASAIAAINAALSDRTMTSASPLWSLRGYRVINSSESVHVGYTGAGRCPVYRALVSDAPELSDDGGFYRFFFTVCRGGTAYVSGYQGVSMSRAAVDAIMIEQDATAYQDLE